MANDEKNSDAARYEMLKSAAEQIADGSFDIKKYYGVTDDALEAIYSIGYEMYNHKQYEKSTGVFTVLTMLDPTSTKYLSACASSCFMEKNFIGALHMFRMSLVNGDYNPKILMRMSECAMNLKQYDDVRRYNDEIINFAKKDEYKNDKETMSYAARAEMMNGMLDSLKNGTANAVGGDNSGSSNATHENVLANKVAEN